MGASSSRSDTGTSSGDSIRRKRLNRKRIRNEDDEEDDVDDHVQINDDDEVYSDKDIEEMLNTPKRRKLQTTSRYIYQTLFREGRESNVTVCAMNHEWRLHKLYLCQSSYFSSMFSGSWKESTMDKIHITVADPTITFEALDVALGSLYQDEITIQPSQVESVLAAATLLQLEGLINQCETLMEETINVETVIFYYFAAQRYGTLSVSRQCMSWLKINLLSHLPEYPQRLREVPLNVMAELVSSPELFVIQTEFSVYVLLRLWLFLILHPTWEGPPQEAVVMSHRFFQERTKNTKEYFLLTEEGKYYEKAFRSLRFSHLINHHMDMEMLLSDRIIPTNWLYPTFLTQWQTLLRMDQGIDKGPHFMSDEDFNKICLRCGRTLDLKGRQHMWRWTGFNMGLDLIVSFDRDTLTLKRNMSGEEDAPSGPPEHEALLSYHKNRHIIYRVTVMSLNEQKQVQYKETTGVKTLTLDRENTVHELLKIDWLLATYPLLLSFNFAVSSPGNSSENAN